MDNIIDKFVLDQLSVWPMAASNFRDLKNVETRSLEVGGLEAERGGHAVMVIEVDQEVPRERIAALEQEEGIEKVIYLCLEE